VTSTTAALLAKAGKTHWIKPRQNSVNVKGKGILETYWLDLTLKVITSTVQNDSSEVDQCNEEGLDETATEYGRLIGWTCELIQGHIRNLIATRKTSTNNCNHCPIQYKSVTMGTPLDEVVEALVLPEYDDFNTNQGDKQSVDLDETVKTQLHRYISAIAEMYNYNPFHNFGHACHVTMSANKLLMRVVSPDIDVDDDNFASHLYDYTHGINSDPITILAIIFSAIIHDADHRGISNIQLMKEDEAMAARYRNKSIAEQNSLDLAWDYFMRDDFIDLRNCLFETMDELTRFRQVLVNVVLATDIFDKELNDLRKNRWNKAFIMAGSVTCHREMQSLRAMIVIEHVIQASDVSHTMQHWHVYRKWNELLFREMYSAFQEGRMGTNPSDFWYQGELGFFDNYIIPLARKLKDCNVFGVSSDEYLNYAEQNRAEWEVRGQEIVAEMVNDVKRKEGKKIMILV
jgi:3'5'-cyclic nucleotide phosphodiesterase